MNEIDTSHPWYWICKGFGESKLAFSCEEASRSFTYAQTTVIKRNLAREEGDTDIWFVREDPEHPDHDYKQFKCPECENLMRKRELDRTWDWSGPHCNNCGCTGMTMFAGVTEHKPVISGRSFIESVKKIFTKG
jgi:hypothetical protein